MHNRGNLDLKEVSGYKDRKACTRHICKMALKVILSEPFLMFF
jgi:hypothetical protein